MVDIRNDPATKDWLSKAHHKPNNRGVVPNINL